MNTREQAMQWWNNLARYSHESPESRESIALRYTSREFNSLTGREIEAIWKGEKENAIEFKSPQFVITKDTQQIFDLRGDQVMQISEMDNEIFFLRKSTFEEVYKDEEKIMIPASRVFRALQAVHNHQMKFFVQPSKHSTFL